MKIITWNVNSVKSRLIHLTSYLKTNQPDVVLLQETKTIDENFPRMEIEELGYNVAHVGQKSYNGVAILSKSPVEDLVVKLPGDDADLEARYIEGVVRDTRVVSVYVPNGMDVASHKFQYKLKFFERLSAHFAGLLEYDEKLVIGGDFNVAPDAIDLVDAVKSEGRICFNIEERARFRAILNLGLTDVFRTINPGMKKFSWWDYRAGAWEANAGLRIDHLLASPEAADRMVAAGIDTAPRALEKPSDHTPVWCKLEG